MASFISREVRLRVYLRDKVTGAGGEWADFGESGQYDTNDPEIIELLEKNPAFNVDYVRASGNKDIVFGCPQCDYEKPKSRSVISHALKVHKANYTKADLIEKKVKVGV